MKYGRLTPTKKHCIINVFKESFMPKAKPPFIRLLDGYTVDKNGCWIWQSSKHKNGYGWLKVFGKVVSAHRYSYQLHKGDIPEGLEIMHSCDVRCCINPDHLRAGTHQENMAQVFAKNGFNKANKGNALNKKPRQSNVVMVLGKLYESQKQAEKSLGLGSGTVAYWIKTNNPKASLIKKGELNE
jgi:hypothetical protein